jgi:hypothetical protein
MVEPDADLGDIAAMKSFFNGNGDDVGDAWNNRIIAYRFVVPAPSVLTSFAFCPTISIEILCINN